MNALILILLHISKFHKENLNRTQFAKIVKISPLKNPQYGII